MLQPAKVGQGPSVRKLRQFTAGAGGALRTIQSWPFVAYLLSTGVVLSSVLLIALALSLSIIESILWAFTAGSARRGPTLYRLGDVEVKPLVKMKALGKRWCGIVHDPMQARPTRYRGQLDLLRKSARLYFCFLKNLDQNRDRVAVVSRPGWMEEGST